MGVGHAWLFHLVGLLEDKRFALYVTMILSLLLDVLLHFYCCNDEIRNQSNVPSALPLGKRYHGTQSISKCVGPTAYLDTKPEKKISEYITSRNQILHSSRP